MELLSKGSVPDHEEPGIGRILDPSGDPEEAVDTFDWLETRHDRDDARFEWNPKGEPEGLPPLSALLLGNIEAREIEAEWEDDDLLGQCYAEPHEILTDLLRDCDEARGVPRESALDRREGGGHAPAEVAGQDMAVEGVHDHRRTTTKRKQRRNTSQGPRLRGVCVQDLRPPFADLPDEERQ